VVPVAGNTYTGSDIHQTTPTSISNPTYLAAPGIQIGPGVDLVTKTAGGRGFSTYNYPTTIYYGARGTFNAGVTGYLWPGTELISGSYPDSTTPAARYRVQQPLILSGMSVSMNSVPTGPTGTNNLTVAVVYSTSLGGPIYPISGYSLLYNADSPPNQEYYNSSFTLNMGWYIHVYVVAEKLGVGNNAGTDLSIQLDLF
jgi:hypothetical protein